MIMRWNTLLIFIALTSCNHLSVQRGESNPRPIAASTEYKLDSFLWGFVSGTRLSPESELCPGGRIEAFDLRMSATDVLFSTVTIGIYVPHRVNVACSKLASTQR